MASVTVSPDGRHVAAIISPDGARRAIAVWASFSPVTVPEGFSNRYAPTAFFL